MTRRSRIWLIVAVLFTLANLASAGIAVAEGELHHAGIHVGVLLLGGYFLGRFAARRIDGY